MNLQEVRNIIKSVLKEEFESDFQIVPADMKYAEETWNTVYGSTKGFGFKSALSYTDENLSKSIMKDGEIIGVYLLGNTQLPQMLGYFDDAFYKQGFSYTLEDGVDIESYKTKNGVNGIHLYVEPEYRSQGYGKALIEYAESIGDYIWGMHDLKLQNIDNWLKRRKMIGKVYHNGNLDGYITST